MTAAPSNADLFLGSERLPGRLDAVLSGGAYLALAFGALAMGAVDPESQFVLRSLSLALFMVWAMAQLVQGKLSITPSPIYAPALAFAGLVIAQMVLGITAYRHDTMAELLNYACYGLFAFVLLQSLRGSHSANRLVLGISWFGLVVSVFALLQSFVSNGKLFWFVEVPNDAFIFGPYVNHNHYAGLMEMLIPFPLVFAAQSSTGGVKRFFFGLCAIVMGVSLVESGSRGGIIALACQIVLLVMIGRFTKIKHGAAVALLMILVAIAGLLAVVADSGVTARITALREPGRADVAGWRMHLNRDSLSMMRARPILGWGLDSFSTVYPKFRSFYNDVPINEAHNDYLQLLAETGVVGGLIVLWFLVVVFREGWRNLRRSETAVDKGIRIAAIVSVSGILIHSASDFNLHIPANAAIFFLMCAFVVAPLSRREEHSAGELQKKGKLVIPSEVRPLGHVEEFPQRLRVVVRRY